MTSLKIKISSTSPVFRHFGVTNSMPLSLAWNVLTTSIRRHSVISIPDDLSEQFTHKMFYYSAKWTYTFLLRYRKSKYFSVILIITLFFFPNQIDLRTQFTHFTFCCAGKRVPLLFDPLTSHSWWVTLTDQNYYRRILYRYWLSVHKTDTGRT